MGTVGIIIEVGHLKYGVQPLGWNCYNLKVVLRTALRAFCYNLKVVLRTGCILLHDGCTPCIYFRQVDAADAGFAFALDDDEDDFLGVLVFVELFHGGEELLLVFDDFVVDLGDEVAGVQGG